MPNDHSALRWWTGSVWSDHISVLGALPPNQPSVEEPAELIRTSKLSPLTVASHILEAGTVLLIFVAHTLELLLLGLLISAATLVIEVFVVRRRRREGAATIGAIVLNILIGCLGLIWFAFVLIAANVITLERLGY
jgi:hypothetical protein